LTPIAHLLTWIRRISPASAEQSPLRLLIVTPIKQANETMTLGSSFLHIHLFSVPTPANVTAHINRSMRDVFGLDTSKLANQGNISTMVPPQMAKNPIFTPNLTSQKPRDSDEELSPRILPSGLCKLSQNAGDPQPKPLPQNAQASGGEPQAAAGGVVLAVAGLG
jgi:hypothetical protein